MKTLIRLFLLLFLVFGAVYFFTFKVKGKHVEIEMKKDPGLSDIKKRAAEVEKEAVETVKKALPSGKTEDVRSSQPSRGDEPSEQDREALRKIIREKLGKE